MSLADDRQRFADALSTVTDVTGHTHMPSTLNTGDAWPRWTGSDREDGRAFLHLWDVAVVLPVDDIETGTWTDDHLDALVDALEANVGFVERVEPVVLPQNQFGLRLTVRGD